MPRNAPPSAVELRSASAASSAADSVTTSTPPAFTTSGVFGVVTGMFGCTLLMSGTHAGFGARFVLQTAGSTRSTAASRLPPFENAIPI